MKTILFYFTGTGNNLAAARQLGSALGDTRVAPMGELMKNKVIDPSFDWVGFFAPCYYSHVPPFVEACMKDLVFAPHQKLLLVAGCGGNRGLTIQDMRKAAQQCGKTPQLEYMLTFPGNYILSYGSFPAFYRNICLRGAARKIRRIAEDMRNDRKMEPLGVGMFYSAKHEESVQQTSAGYAQVAKEYTVSPDCTGCGLCTKVGPVGNISLQNGKLEFGDSCNQCMACIQWCPQRAIDHNGLAINRKRYHHPQIKAQDLNGNE